MHFTRAAERDSERHQFPLTGTDCDRSCCSAWFCAIRCCWIWMFWATADCRKARWTFCWYTRIWLGVMFGACGVCCCCCCWRPGTLTPAKGRGRGGGWDALGGEGGSSFSSGSAYYHCSCHHVNYGSSVFDKCSAATTALVIT